MKATEPKFKILFLCTGNSIRSQMAEGWARHLHGETIEIYSAGIIPVGLNANAVEVMAEVGVDISRQESKHVGILQGIAFGCVVTLCSHAREHCPIFPGKVKTIHVEFDDPSSLAIASRTREEMLFHYRRVRDEIRTFVEKMPGNLDLLKEDLSN
jgi:arsenate reductase